MVEGVEVEIGSGTVVGTSIGAGAGAGSEVGCTELLELETPFLPLPFVRATGGIGVFDLDRERVMRGKGRSSLA